MEALQKKLLSVGLGTAIALSGATLVAHFEGKMNKAYVDPVGIYTICYGQTAGVKKGDYKTDEQCLESLANELSRHNTQMLKYVHVPLSEEEHAAYLSFTYNLGVGSFSKSTLLKKLNKGDREGACNELSRWVYAGGVKLNGLVKRREAERQLCLAGVEKYEMAQK